ncbi:hypothetical protein [Myxococcus landrumensis]|uniref:Helix-turn-helix domain-containing protein n=1 Tax=Myxococcus landrumensis TaxID=2813577 RepID=A0ABX7MWV3_9BACT|nr:hypothetical protein [Myxococcus landrumus]QSQ10776.1 hypothetical protein JY572_20270 [Myxococcus landrumus]
MSAHPTGPGLDGPSITVERAAELLQCKRTRVFELLAEGRLKRAPKFGKKTTVILESVLACFDTSEKSAVLRQRKHHQKCHDPQSLEAAFRAAALSAEGSSG